MSVRPISTRPLVHARRMALAGADNLSLALAFEGMPDRRYSIALDEAEVALTKALDLIRTARGPVPPVPPPAAIAQPISANTGLAPVQEVA